jgi:hypothetical protein
MEKNKKFKIILGLTFPIIILSLLFFGIIFYLRLSKPTLDFLFVTSRNSNCLFHYSVLAGRVVERVYSSSTVNNTCVTELNIYETASDTTRKISLLEAQGLLLSPSRKSLDGFTFSFGEASGGGFLKPVTFDYSIYLEKNGYKRKLNLSQYNNPLYFIGWIKQ